MSIKGDINASHVWQLLPTESRRWQTSHAAPFDVGRPTRVTEGGQKNEKKKKKRKKKKKTSREKETEIAFEAIDLQKQKKSEAETGESHQG